MTAAKKVGVKVIEFGIGIPPRIAKLRKKGETQYTLNLIPLGGFVRMFGDNPSDEASYTENGAYHKATRRQKIIILIAGIVMNVLTARVIFTVLFAIGTKPLSIVPDSVQSQSYLMPSKSYTEEYGLFTTNTKTPARITDTATGSRAAAQNIEPDTIITKINNTTVYAYNLTETIQAKCTNGCTITRQPPVMTKPQSATFQCGEKCLLGVMIDTKNVFGIRKIQFPLRQAPLKA